MASTAYYRFLGSNVPGIGVVSFTFKSNGGTLIDQTTITPQGASKIASVVWVSAGLHTVTMTDDSLDVLFASASVDDAVTPDFGRATLRFSGSGGRKASPLSFTVNTFAATGVTLADLPAGRVISVLLVLRKTQGR